MIGIQSEIRATTVLSILDCVRQRGLDADGVAAAADVDADRIRVLLDNRDSSDFSLDELDGLLASVEACGTKHGR